METYNVEVFLNCRGENNRLVKTVRAYSSCAAAQLVETLIKSKIKKHTGNVINRIKITRVVPELFVVPVEPTETTSSPNTP